MTKVLLLCRVCGAKWISLPAQQLVRQSGRCLRCDGDLVEERSEDESDVACADESPNGPPESP